MFDEQEKARIIQLARVIASVERQKEAALASRDFELAAQLRQQQDALSEQLGRLNLPHFVAKNIRRVHDTLQHLSYPVLNLLQPETGGADSNLLDKFPSPPKLRTRVLVGSVPASPVGTLSSALAIDDMFSPYFRAVLPVFSTDILVRPTRVKCTELLRAAFRETERCKERDTVVVSVVQPSDLAKCKLLDEIMRGLHETLCDFAIFEQHDRIAEIESKLTVNYTPIDTTR